MNFLRCTFFILFVAFYSCKQVEEKTSVQVPPKPINPYLKAYPNYITSYENGDLIWQDGTRMLYDDKRNKNYEERLAEADIEDQLFIKYPKGELSQEPVLNQDPGRFRNEAFFKKMYGNNKEEVEAKLKPVYWLPSSLNKKLYISSVNDIHLKLQAISNSLDSLPHLHKYLENPAGSFNWRSISGTDRLSCHSFGIAFDINVKYSNYWKWETGDETIQYKNQIPYEIVAVFEKYGFIWGGKWYHYDTMHFEYRPELLL